MINVLASYSISSPKITGPRSPVPDARYMALDSTMLGASCQVMAGFLLQKWWDF